MSKVKSLSMIYYLDPTYGRVAEFEALTDDFEKWLKEHNEERWNGVSCADEEDEDHINKECTCIEDEDNFKVESVSPILYNKEG